MFNSRTHRSPDRSVTPASDYRFNGIEDNGVCPVADSMDVLENFQFTGQAQIKSSWYLPPASRPS